MKPEVDFNVASVLLDVNRDLAVLCRTLEGLNLSELDKIEGSVTQENGEGSILVALIKTIRAVSGPIEELKKVMLQEGTH